MKFKVSDKKNRYYGVVYEFTDLRKKVHDYETGEDKWGRYSKDGGWWFEDALEPYEEVNEFGPISP